MPGFKVMPAAVLLICFLLDLGEKTGSPNAIIVPANSPLGFTPEQRSGIRSLGWMLVELSSSAKPTSLRLTDEEGIVRRIAPARDAAHAIEFAEEYFSGKAGYQSACVRGHGEDGALDAYPGIRKLNGIGKRLSREELRERMRPVPMGQDHHSVRNHL